MIGTCTPGDFSALAAFIARVSALKKPIIGYLFTRRQLEAAEREFFKERFAFASASPPHTRLADLQRFLDIARLLSKEGTRLQSSVRGDWFAFCRRLLTHLQERVLLRRLAALQETAASLPQLMKQYPGSFERLGIRSVEWTSLCD